jgi:hypothetical protein
LDNIIFFAVAGFRGVFFRMPPALQEKPPYSTYGSIIITLLMIKKLPKINRCPSGAVRAVSKQRRTITLVDEKTYWDWFLNYQNK